LRFFNVYGPGQPVDAFYTSVIVTFLRRMAAGEPVVIDGDGTQTMDFVHVEDVARAVVLAMESDASGRSVNIGTGIQTSVIGLAQALAARLGATPDYEFRPRPALVHRRQAHIGRIGRLLGWTPQIGLDEGLASVVEDVLVSHPGADERPDGAAPQ
jgi:UDP-glucose 4-epimerase